jgi:CPA2 family monovalent cation:H+ antiporter-2
MIRASIPLAKWIASHQPSRVGNMQGMYDSMMERIRRGAVPFRDVVQPILMLAGGTIAIAMIMIFNDVDFFGVTQMAIERFHLDFFETEILVDMAAALLCTPFAAAMYIGATRIATKLVLAALSEDQSRDHTGALTAPARALIAVLRATLLLVCVVPLMALVQPFLEPIEGIGFALVVGTLMVGVLIKSAQTMHGQMHVLKDLLAVSLTRTRALAQSAEDLPGFGMITPIRLQAGASAIGRTLASIDLRALTGAAAIAISRNHEVIVANGGEVLQEGDIVGLSGTSESVEAARRLLTDIVAVPA